ncbi:DUF6542 domain-containing protein [Amycolatopsis pigmentata]|uniref:DUF6542 domain-containing protein n=1 Tax=Amycolatopsis pigmentata TaxID=450801 RepID=A0ABW5FX67_9PSEU
MTALRDRASDSDADEVAIPWDARPIFGARRGLPWWGALLLAFGLALVGAAVDMKTHNALAWVFRICYFVGAVGAVCLVQRRNLFGPMVQPPLIVAVTVPGVVLVVSGFPANADTLTKALTVGTPLINGFPAMAITTGCALAVGIYRLYRERDPDAPARDADRQGDGPKRPAKPARPTEEGRPRPGQPARGGAGRGQRPPEGRGGGRPRPTGENALPPPGRRPPPDDGPRRGDPGGRGGRTPPPGARRPRGPAPDEPPRRRSGGAGGDRPRRQPPRPGDPRGPQGGDPRRGSGRNAPPPRRRPWDDEA